MLTDFDLSLKFFLQLALILGFCRTAGWLAKRLGQPQVVAEMVAGVLLGPSLLGWLWPQAQAWLFPKESLTILYAISQMGIALYMFLVGVEFREDHLIERFRGAASVSLAGMVAPFALGGLIGYWLHGQSGFFGPKVHAWDAVLFMGTAMSITALPTLARIIDERGLAGTTLGTFVLVAGAFGDAAAWGVLALVVASFDHNWMLAAKTIGGGIAYGALILTLGRKWLAKLGEKVEQRGQLTQSMLAFTLVLVMLCSWLTDLIGIYAVFGAFMLGTAMPRGLFTRELQRQLEPFTVVLLLPLFFTYSGLKTRLDLVQTPELMLLTLLVLAAACLGKGGACYAAARLHGEDNRTSLAIGTLMNARGLMELIILNIGLELGIIQPALFSIMVVMAIATTLMATPIFAWVYGGRPRPAGQLKLDPEKVS